MRIFDLSYTVQNGRLTFKAFNENGERAMWDVLSLMEAQSAQSEGISTLKLENVLKALKRKGYTVRPATRKR
jgi:hypothetical protein